MIGEVIIFDGQEWRVLGHKGDYLKVIEMDEESVFPRIKLLNYKAVKYPEILDVNIEDLY